MFITSLVVQINAMNMTIVLIGIVDCIISDYIKLIQKNGRQAIAMIRALLKTGRSTENVRLCDFFCFKLYCEGFSNQRPVDNN